ncbi:LemA family protein [Candidatus Kaiserbacteria bacterium]|nr:LemA family protein [Candidatus Kaiserbacteria bacterium]
MKKWLIGALLVAIVGLVWIAPTYNNMIPLRNKVEQTVGEMQFQYQRRADLIPAIVQSVSAQVKGEKETFTQVAEARAKATSIQLTAEALKDPKAMEAYAANQATLAGALGKLLSIQEKYPDLKQSEAFNQARVTLEETENRIKFARKEFNTAVKAYNDKRDPFPANVATLVVGMPHLASFQASADAQNMPAVNF